MALMEHDFRVEDLISAVPEIESGRRTLRSGKVQHVVGFLQPEFAISVTELIAGAEDRRVRARTPDHRGEVVGYAPHVSDSEWRDLPPDQRFLSLGQVADDLLGETADLLRGRVLRDWLRNLSGCDLTESHLDVHIMRRGDFIGTHTDARDGRKLGLLVYLNPVWREEWGGILEYEEGGEELRYVPAFNEALLFRTEALGGHRVTAIDTDEPRLTLGMWFT